MPFRNEHACRVREPGDFVRIRRVSNTDEEGRRIDVLVGPLKSDPDGPTHTQAFRYPVEDWSESAARDHCESNDGSRFEPAEAEEESAHWASDIWIASMPISKTAEEGEEHERTIYGKASSAAVDRQNTVVDQKSLSKALRTYIRNNGKLFYNHNWAVPIGRAVSGKVLEDGAYIKAVIGRGFPVPVRSMAGVFDGSAITMNVDDIWNLIQQRLASSFSIGFRADEEPGEIGKEGKRAPARLLVTDLIETSVVSIPANPEAEFAVTKAYGFPWTETVLKQPRRLTARVKGDAAAASREVKAIPVNWEAVLEALKECRKTLQTRY